MMAFDKVKVVKAWAIVDKKGKLVVEHPAWGTAYVIGPTRSDTPPWNTGERVVRVEIREISKVTRE